MNQWDMLSELSFQLHLAPAQCAAFARLRAGVDYTQNPIEHGGHADGSIPWMAWTAARDVAVAFEQLQKALNRLHDEVIPF